MGKERNIMPDWMRKPTVDGKQPIWTPWKTELKWKIMLTGKGHTATVSESWMGTQIRFAISSFKKIKKTMNTKSWMQLTYLWFTTQYAEIFKYI
jgi:hypothetical protein